MMNHFPDEPFFLKPIVYSWVKKQKNADYFDF